MGGERERGREGERERGREAQSKADWGTLHSIFGLKGERKDGGWVLTDNFSFFFFFPFFCHLRFVLLLILALVLQCPAFAAIDFFFALRLLDW